MHFADVCPKAVRIRAAKPRMYITRELGAINRGCIRYGTNTRHNRASGDFGMQRHEKVTTAININDGELLWMGGTSRTRLTLKGANPAL